MIAFKEVSLPILLYRKTKTNEVTIFRKIANPVNNCCYTINYCYDEIERKTCFFFGFSKSYVGMYDLKFDKWEKTEFETTGDVSSMNFLFRKKNSTSSISLMNLDQRERFLIYSQWNKTLVIANIDTRKIVRTIDLKDVSSIADCCVWNTYQNNSQSKYVIVTTKDSNSIQILDFDNFNVLFIKKLETNPISLIKFYKKIDEKNQENYQECISCFLQNKIAIFERKNN